MYSDALGAHLSKATSHCMICGENTNTAVHVTDHTSKLISQMIFGAGRNYYGALHARNTNYYYPGALSHQIPKTMQ